MRFNTQCIILVKYTKSMIYIEAISILKADYSKKQYKSDE